MIWTAKSEDAMNINRETQTSSISKAASLEEIGDYWDTHSLDEHWNETSEVEFDVRAKRRHRIIVEPEIYEQLEAEARIRGVVPETLVNLWLAEKLHGPAR